MFGGLGDDRPRAAPGRGVFPDMMPYRVKLYGNDDCLLHYEDPHAAPRGPSFFDGQELKGSKLHVDGREEAEPGPTRRVLRAPRPRASPTALGGAGRGGRPPRQHGPPGGGYGGGGGGPAGGPPAGAGRLRRRRRRLATTTAATGATTTAATGRAGRSQPRPRPRPPGLRRGRRRDAAGSRPGQQRPALRRPPCARLMRRAD